MSNFGGKIFELRRCANHSNLKIITKEPRYFLEGNHYFKIPPVPLVDKENGTLQIRPGASSKRVRYIGCCLRPRFKHRIMYPEKR